MALNNPYTAYQKSAKTAENAKNAGLEPTKNCADQSVVFEKTQQTNHKMTYSRNVVCIKKPLSETPDESEEAAKQAEPTSDIPEKDWLPANGIEHKEPEKHAQQPNQYLENAVLTASPQELTLMLYDGALRFMNQAVLCIQGNKIAKAHEVSIKAQDIIFELLITLNTDYEIGKTLHPLYTFILDNLHEANLKKDIAIYREMISLVRELRDTWQEAMKSMK